MVTFYLTFSRKHITDFALLFYNLYYKYRVPFCVFLISVFSYSCFADICFKANGKVEELNFLQIDRDLSASIDKNSDGLN